MVQIYHLRLEELLAAEGEQLSRQPRGLFARLQNQTGILMQNRITPVALRDQFSVTNDRGEQVVKVVRDTARETPDRFHLLRMPQLFVFLAQAFLRRPALLHFAEEIVALLEKL